MSKVYIEFKEVVELNGSGIVFSASYKQAYSIKIIGYGFGNIGDFNIIQYLCARLSICYRCFSFHFS